MSNYSNYQEYLKHPLFRIIRRMAMEKAGWVCRDCKKSKATSVHHIRYPKWGTFDTVDNLVPICHNCHCKRHGVEN